jgi:hypothetical protein
MVIAIVSHPAVFYAVVVSLLLILVAGIAGGIHYR